MHYGFPLHNYQHTKCITFIYYPALIVRAVCSKISDSRYIFMLHLSLLILYLQIALKIAPFLQYFILSKTSRSDHRKPKDTESNRHGIDKKRLLEIARKNAITMLQNGALPAAVSLGPLAQQKVISAIKSGGMNSNDFFIIFITEK